ncbi:MULTISPECIES: hypothetical protein [Sphingobacterium]|uniref:hypothetical protein n=1 Tax=Sphingobacterium TaxID=28453 RepID=UPI00095AB920|nr:MULTISPECIES: hypothetical protein [Sphingobacterium]OJZ02120.1 MAG: hypothetical protein BGP15_11610 [Sphingobacterium sp. 40-24]
MQNLIDDTGKERFHAEFSMYYAGIIYLLLLNRISFGFTREEMAFLMGQEETYVKEMEELKIPAGNLEVMVHLNWVFNRRKVDISKFDNKTSYRFEFTIWEGKGIRHYQMEYFINAVETITFFQLMEEINAEDKAQAEQDVCERMAVEVLLDKLLEMNYFKKYRTPLELWRYVEKYLEENIRVKSLMQELGVFAGKKGSAPLRKTKAKSFGFRYIEHK